MECGEVRLAPAVATAEASEHQGRQQPPSACYLREWSPLGMTSVDTPSGRYLQFERLTGPDEWAGAYRQCGLPARADGAGMILMLTGKDVAAVYMPDFLGRH